SDVAIDVLRGLAGATAWFGSLALDEIVVIPGYAATELIYGCVDTIDQRNTERWLSRCRIVWLEPRRCDTAFRSLLRVHLGNAIGVLDSLIGQVAISLGLPLYTFN